MGDAVIVATAQTVVGTARAIRHTPAPATMFGSPADGDTRDARDERDADLSSALVREVLTS